jgi:hypothetical protein
MRRVLRSAIGIEYLEHTRRAIALVAAAKADRRRSVL